MCILTLYFCKKCSIEFYGDYNVTYCPFCGKELKHIGIFDISELEGIVYNLRYAPNGKLRKKLKRKNRNKRIKIKSHHEHLEKKKKEFMNELNKVLGTVIEADTPWYDGNTTLREEIIKRFEKIFGKIKF